ncbi:MAG: hypothetical protein P1Q69_13010 [Candidatus Thorarchaeota archaeon]|nr:hypothetical protein [Candidatus Thorarchaeota archaeon]
MYTPAAYDLKKKYRTRIQYPMTNSIPRINLRDMGFTSKYLKITPIKLNAIIANIPGREISLLKSPYYLSLR